MWDFRYLKIASEYQYYDENNGYNVSQGYGYYGILCVRGVSVCVRGAVCGYVLLFFVFCVCVFFFFLFFFFVHWNSH
jgi:hypothetical protein